MLEMELMSILSKHSKGNYVCLHVSKGHIYTGSERKSEHQYSNMVQSERHNTNIVFQHYFGFDFLGISFKHLQVVGYRNLL